MNNPVYSFPLRKILEALEAKQGKSDDWWYSPLRDEKNPSLHIDEKKNLWYDFGIGRGGTNVELVQLILRCSKAEAVRYIISLSPELQAIEVRRELHSSLSGNSRNSATTGSVLLQASTGI